MADGLVSSVDRRHPTLMIPGPCSLPAEATAILAQPVVPHYGPDWAEGYHALVASLRRLLGAHTVHVLPGSGSAALEAAVVNLLRPGQRVVVPDTGYFGRRLAEIAAAHRIGVDLLEVPCGEPVDVARVAARIRRADGVLVVHVETSSGVRHPVEGIAREARAAGAVCLVDAIASVGGEELDLQAMGIDAAVTASQKGLGAAPGLGIVAFDPGGWARVSANRPLTWYFDLRRWEQARVEDQWEPHPVTMPTSLVAVLAYSVGRILDHGVAHWIERRADLAAYLRARLAGLGLPLLAAVGHRANLVTVVECPSADEVARYLLDRHHILVARGLAPYEDDVLRIGLMGSTASYEAIDHLAGALAGRPR